MSFMIPRSYLVKPRDHLKEKLNGNQSEHFMRQHIWKVEEYYDPLDSDNELTESLRIVKIIFMLDLMKSQIFQRKILEDLLGTPMDFSIQSFDKWWTVERIEVHSSYDQVIRNTSLEDILTLQQSDKQIVDEWIEVLKDSLTEQ